MKNHLNEMIYIASGYRIGPFTSFSHMKKASLMKKTQLVVNKLFFRVHFKWVEKYYV